MFIKFKPQCTAECFESFQYSMGWVFYYFRENWSQNLSVFYWMTVNVIFPNILDVFYKQFHFSIKKTQNSGRYWAQVTCYLIVSVISVEACCVFHILLLIWSPTLEKRVKLLEN